MDRMIRAMCTLTVAVVAVSASSVAHVDKLSQQGAKATAPGEYHPVGCGDSVLWTASGQWDGNATTPVNCKRLVLNSSYGLCGSTSGTDMLLPSLTIEALTGPHTDNFNVSAPFQASGNEQTTVSVLNSEGMIIGGGRAVGEKSKSSGYFPVSFNLDYACVVPEGSRLVPAYAACSCVARARLAIKGNSTGCHYNTPNPLSECGNNVAITPECHAHYKDGCNPRQRGNYPEKCDYCQFETDEMWIQTQWVVSCRVPTATHDAVCTGVYTEEGTTRNSMPVDYMPRSH